MSIHLNHQLMDHILKYVGHDKPALFALSQTCRELKALVIDNERYHYLASYILSTYEIVATNMSRGCLWFNLKYCKLLSLGEMHDSDNDRMSNAQCIHLMWKNKISLFLETPPAIGIGALKHVNPLIATQGKSWDISEEIKTITFLADGMIRLGTLGLVQQYLFLEDEKADRQEL